MSEIQSIVITGTITIPKPKPHLAYLIQISTPTRTWVVQRRYNDFVALHTELVASTNKEPPASLPPKHWGLARTMGNDMKIRERRIKLETYLRVILNTKDSRWRTSFGFNDFLAVPIRAGSTSSKSVAFSTANSTPEHFTPANWLIEHGSVEGQLRSARSAFLKRDTLARMGDSSGGRGASGEGRRLLRDSGPRIETLDRSLKTLVALGDGERRRREDMIEALRAEHANLIRTAEAGFRASIRSDSPPQTPPPPQASSMSGGSTMPGGAGPLFTPTPPRGRVFGRQAQPVETTETRALDDRGLVQLQQNKMTEQDGQLGELSHLLQRQRKMGEEIAEEISVQNELLDQIENDTTRVGSKLARAKREMNKLG